MNHGVSETLKYTTKKSKKQLRNQMLSLPHFMEIHSMI